MKDKITLHKNEAFICEELDGRLKDFLTSVFAKFEIELNNLAVALYPEDPETVFDGIEATWVGILNNAIIKKFVDDVSTMQEFSAKVNSDKHGRADYFVRFKNEYDLLFEVKTAPENGTQYDIVEMENWYDKILAQSFKYYEFNVKEYKNETFLVAMVFGWIKNGKALERAKRQMNIFREKPIDSTDFWALYYLDNSGISVYGKIKNAKEFFPRVR